MRAQAVVFTGVRQVQYMEVEVPEPGPEDVVIDLEYSWISNGTESSFLYGERISGEQVTRPDDILPFPQVAGYQKVGIVQSVGDQVKGLAPGDRVFASVSMVSGMMFDSGGHINPSVTHESQVWKLPENADPIAYSGMVLTQVGYNCGIRPTVSPGDVAVVIGDGMVGQWAAQTLAHRGAVVTVLGRHDQRLALLPSTIHSYNLKQNALEDWIGDRTDIAVVVDTVGAMDTFRELKPAMKLNSHLVSAGFLGDTGMVDIQELRPQEITLHSPSGWTEQRMEDTLIGIRDGWLQTLPLITHRFKAKEAEKAWQMIMDKSEFFLGVILEW
ncbi:alcohol dehydrogenase catalytic domain-containing protein [Cohnella sp. WQ 127256]|uniref:alcohol dehydrogenase catalytic domain-containing protein n=1 Tax=Cohnella sp. WQ 127256 TaxID=2938790 RepID=UPI002118E5C8|nr:alcohol dehydrogenase catalytic domain-containing protein [Cohnella sp. WQ 127256]